MSDDYLDEMMNQAPGAINFTMFLTLFGERLQGTDPEDVIKNAFACFDEANVGELHLDNPILAKFWPNQYDHEPRKLGVMPP